MRLDIWDSKDDFLQQSCIWQKIKHNLAETKIFQGQGENQKPTVFANWSYPSEKQMFSYIWDKREFFKVPHPDSDAKNGRGMATHLNDNIWKRWIPGP